MAEQLKDRKDMDPAFLWDLSSLFKDDEAWEEAFAGLSQKVDAVAAFDGKIVQADDGETAKNIRALLEAETELDLLLSDLFSYANLRRSEDTRAPQAQPMPYLQQPVQPTVQQKDIQIPEFLKNRK